MHQWRKHVWSPRIACLVPFTCELKSFPWKEKVVNELTLQFSHLINEVESLIWITGRKTLQAEVSLIWLPVFRQSSFAYLCICLQVLCFNELRWESASEVVLIYTKGKLGKICYPTYSGTHWVLVLTWSDACKWLATVPSAVRVTKKENLLWHNRLYLTDLSCLSSPSSTEYWIDCCISDTNWS